MSRPTLRQLRRRLLAECLSDGGWWTASECSKRLGLGGSDWYRVCTALERLANDGLAELQRPGSRVRRFRRRERA